MKSPKGCQKPSTPEKRRRGRRVTETEKLKPVGEGGVEELKGGGEDRRRELKTLV